MLDSHIYIPAKSKVKQDEVHMILEFAIGDQWGQNEALVANRFITSHDETNGKASMLETFFLSSKSYSPDLIIFSGMFLYLENRYYTL